MKYLLDSNVFIEAKNRYSAFDVCPGFWTWMDHVVSSDVHSLLMVRDELLSGNDELAKWVDTRKQASWFLKVDDPATQANFIRIAAAVQAGNYSAAAKASFLSGADPWLVAQAKTMGATVVTLEVRDINAKRRVPLPNVCDGESVPFMNTFELLQRLAAKFHFKKPPTKGAPRTGRLKPSK